MKRRKSLKPAPTIIDRINSDTMAQVRDALREGLDRLDVAIRALLPIESKVAVELADVECVEVPAELLAARLAASDALKAEFAALNKIITSRVR